MKHIASLTIFVMLLSSCTSLPAFISTSTPTPTPTLTATPTVVPSATPSPTPTISPAVTMLDAYLAGEQVDTSSLSPVEFADFSKALADKRNEDRGIQLVIYDSGNDNPAYIDQNLDMRPYDGKPDQRKTIEMFIPVAGFDNLGNLRIKENEENITIANSADVVWNIIVTDPNDPRIDWPTGDEDIKWRIEKYIYLKPVIILDNYMHSFYVQGSGMRDALRILTVEETDINGVPILLRLSLIFDAPWFVYMKEGTEIDFWRRGEHSYETFNGLLKTYSVYYLGIRTDINDVYKRNLINGSVDNYQGVVSNDDMSPVLKNELENKQDFLAIPVTILLAHN